MSNGWEETKNRIIGLMLDVSLLTGLVVFVYLASRLVGLIFGKNKE